ncbi:unnamed protein product [Enterobius vermicularis]|uniref:Transposase n=1 Tax=Enterobius vermicularis TaxID=51028 RepID=A0A0N4UW87_ENTVE|nr:unnamed protein product [Enterobius vermicularis]
MKRGKFERRKDGQVTSYAVRVRFNGYLTLVLLTEVQGECSREMSAPLLLVATLMRIWFFWLSHASLGQGVD